MRRLAVVALVAAAACHPAAHRPAPTAAPPTSARPLPPAALRIRAAVAKALASCPCEVRINAVASRPGVFNGEILEFLSGVYDPATRSVSLHTEIEPGVEVRVVRGRTFVAPGRMVPGVTTKWAELDFSHLPARNRTALNALPAMDPGMFFAMGASVVGVSLYGANDEVEVDMAAAVAAAGPSGPLLRRLVPTPSAYTTLFTSDGLDVFLESVAPAGSTVSADMAVVRGGVRAVPAPLPVDSTLVDVTKVTPPPHCALDRLTIRALTFCS
jgi:predicted enzyme related to lactoylglutathione lyase